MLLNWKDEREEIVNELELEPKCTTCSDLILLGRV